MPRKNRRTALALVFALLVCLAGQAAVAMPLAGPRGDHTTTAASALSAAWAWFASHWANLGNLVVSSAHHAPSSGHVMGAGAGDPNGSH